MLDEVLIVAGCLVVVTVFLDAFMTTLAVASGAGPVTTVVLAGVWRLLLRVHRQDREGGFLTAAGPVILAATVLTWVVALWGGWSLVFAGSDAVVTAQKARPAGVGDVVYFTGFTVFTLGTGDFVASSAGWRVVMAFASFSGLFLVTLAITYLISVVSAVVARRALAIQIHGLGDSPSSIVSGGWSGDGFGSMFQQQLVTLGSAVATSGEQHLAYPVLHYFHSSTRQLAAPVAIANLDEALTVIESMAPEHRTEPSASQSLRSAISRYLAAATGTAWAPKVGVPPPPNVDELSTASIPVDDVAAARVADGCRERRTHLHRLLASDGWSWPPNRIDLPRE